MQQPLATFGLSLRDQLFRRMPLQIGHDSREIGCGEGGVEMVVEDDPCGEAQPLVLATIG